MFKIDVIAAGRLRPSPLLDVFQEYQKRMQWQLNIIELESKNQADLENKFIEKIQNQAYTMALDERGKSLKSRNFANKLQNLSDEGQNHIQFIIGEANGLPQSVTQKSDFLLSFGNQTWPHMLCRVMLIEQVYRAQQIIAGHPYHRD